MNWIWRYSVGDRTSDAGDGLLAGQIGDVNEGIVERGEDVGYAEDKLALSDLGAERDGVLLLLNLDFFGGLWKRHPKVSFRIHQFKRYA